MILPSLSGRELVLERYEISTYSDCDLADVASHLNQIQTCVSLVTRLPQSRHSGFPELHLVSCAINQTYRLILERIRQGRHMAAACIGIPPLF